MDKNPFIRQAIETVGGLRPTAEAVGASSYQSVQQWIAAGRVPAAYCPALEAVSGISRRFFREDWQRIWPELATQQEVA